MQWEWYSPSVNVMGALLRYNEMMLSVHCQSLKEEAAYPTCRRVVAIKHPIS